MKKLTKIKFKYFIILIILVISYFILVNLGSTFMRYYMEVDGSAVGYGASNSYTINYDLDGGTQAVGQVETFSSTDLPITLLNPTKSGYTFQGWFDNSSFTGTPITQISTVGNYSLYAKWVEEIYVAEVNGTFYTTVNDAIYSGVQTDGTPTTVRILKDVSLTTADAFNPTKPNTYYGTINVQENKNVILDISNHTISNGGNNTPIFENYGTLSISSGTITTSANQGAINNETTGSLYISGNVEVKGSGKQAIWNNGGFVEISENAKLSTTSNIRPAVHNLSGTMYILGGDIISTRYYGVQADDGTLIIGTQDGSAQSSSPSIRGTTGVYSEIDYSFYDGIIKGSTDAVNDVTKIVNIETGAYLTNGREKIGSTDYKTIFLIEHPVTITFNPNGGTVDENTRIIEQGTAIGTLPTPTYTGRIFMGWCILPNEADPIDENTIINNDVELVAQWITGAAKVNGTEYLTIEEALSHVPSGTPTTVEILTNIVITDAAENATSGGRIKIPSGKNITLDLGNYTISNEHDVNTPLIENYGTLTIINGTLTSDAMQGIINNKRNGNLTISGGNIIATGSRQALYNDGGTATITGTAILTSSTTERGTVQNLNNGNLTITGGTITSTGSSGVVNVSGTVTIGNDDGTILQTPVIRGETTGIDNSGTLKYYDGIIFGVQAAFTGTTPTIPTGYQIDTTTETINSTQYEKATLVAN